MMLARATIRAHLLLLAAAVALPLTAVFAYSTYTNFGRQAESARALALNLAEMTAGDAASLLGSSRELIKLLAERPLVRAFDPAACDPLLKSGLHDIFPRFANFVAVNPAGQVVCSSRGEPGQGLRSVADREWFQQVVRDKSFVTSKPVPGAITGRPVSALAQAVVDAQGTLLGVLALPVDLLSYRPSSVGVSMPEGTVLGLFRADGTVLWRSAEPAKWIGRSIAGHEVVPRLLALRRGSLEGPGAEGVPMIYGVSPVAGAEWFAYAALPRAQVYGGIYRDATRTLLLGAGGLGLAGMLAWVFARRLTRPVRELGEVARAVKAGALEARVGVGGSIELAEAGAQFNAMLDQRQQQQELLLRNEERFRDLVDLSSDWYWEQDADLRFTLMSREPHDRPLVPARSTLGKTRWELPSIIGVGAEEWREHRALLERREPFRDFVYQGVNEAGGVRWSSISGKPVFGADGAFRGYRGTGQDITERRNAELALRESDRRFRALVELSSDWYWEQDENLRFVYREGAVLDTMGVPIQADYGKTRWEMDFLNMSEAQWASHRAALERREEFRGLLLQRARADGGSSWAVISGRALFDAAGKFTGYHGIGRDVTARVAAEEALRRSEAQLRLVVDNVPAMIAFYDADDVCRFCNNAYADYAGLKPQQVIGRHQSNVASAKGYEAVRARLAEVAAGNTVQYVRRHEHRAGRADYLEITLVPYRTVDDRFGGRFVLMNNVTSLMQAQEQMRESEQRFRAVFEACPLPLTLSREADGSIFDVNPAWVVHSGYAREAAIGRSSLELDVWFDAKDRDHMVRMLAERGAIDRLEIRDRARDGAIRIVELYIRRVGASGSQWLLSVFNDVTQARGIERRIRELNDSLEQRVALRTGELAAANQELEAFAYSVSHDLRAPLRGIDGYSQLLLSEHAAGLGEEARQHLQRIRRGIQRMGVLIDDLLALSRVTRGRLDRVEIDVSAMAAEVAEELARQEPGRRVDWRIEPGLHARADPGLMGVLLDNLLGNAWKYSRDAAPAVIELGASALREDGVEFFVRDNGAGFDMAHAGRLFTPFQRLHTDAEFEGTGVGLATVQRIVQRHGGGIRAHAEPGKGAVFHVWLADGGSTE